MAKVTMKKSSKAGKTMNLISSGESHEMLLMGSALGEQMMGMMSQVVTTRRGMGAAATALAMAWATLKDIAMCEGVEVESLFENRVAFYEGILVER
jgi:hypothetical protein